MSRTTFSIIALAFCTSTALQALTLQEGVDEVLSTHPVVLERLHNYRATLEDLRMTESQYLPNVDYSGKIAREQTKNRFTEFQNLSFTSYENSLQLTQNLFNGFGTVYEADYNKARILAAANHYIENANDAAFTFVTNYIAALKNRDLLCIAKANVDFNEEIFVKVNKLFDAGMTTRSEAEKADTSLSLAKANYVVAQNNLADSLYNLERVLGKSVKIEELKDIEFSGTIPSSMEEMKEFARTHNPSILVRDYNIKAANAKREGSYRNYYPQIDAYARKSWSSNTSGMEGTDQRSAFGLNVTYNLYRGNMDEAQIQKNISSLQQENENKRETIRRLDEQGELSWSAKQHISDQLVHLKRYQQTSEKTLELYKKEYDLGRRTLLDLLVAQNDYIAAESQIVRSENDLLLAYYRILDAMGAMVQNILGPKAEDFTKPVGLKLLDNSRSNDENVENLIFADRKNGVYKRDTE